MKRVNFVILATGIMFLAFASDMFAQRGGRGGGGGGRGGGYSGGGGGGRPGGGGFTAPAQPAARPQAPAARPQAPAARPQAAAPRSAPPTASQLPTNSWQGTGPGGGSWQAGKGGGSYTTKGGSTIDYKGAGVGGTTGGGTNAGRVVGGVQVTTPGGQEINKVGKAGGATGPGGNTAVKGGSIANTTGPAGSGSAANRAGAVSGPGGMAGYRGGVAVGPGGAAAGRTTVASGARGTYYRSAGAISGQGAYVRAGFAGYGGCFTRTWYGRYPGAWFPGKWAGATAWAVASWASLAAYGGGYYPAEPVSYDYGSEVVYQDGSVYVDGDVVGTEEQYAAEAAAIADAGTKAEVTMEEEWMPLGVFAMVQGEETTSNNIFQLAVNKQGVIRGNYYNALTDTVEPVHGSVDKKTQRAAWTVGDKKSPVYEAGIVNLTKDDTTMMVHYGKDRSQQFNLFRIPEPTEAPKETTPPANK
ncbi:MAG TPA: hypothetical protein VGZ47_17950 [Gemmataceae bacterium]|nr:hypothetical protein [Gemmataceae bacterium]